MSRTCVTAEQKGATYSHAANTGHYLVIVVSDFIRPKRRARPSRIHAVMPGWVPLYCVHAVIPDTHPVIPTEYS